MRQTKMKRHSPSVDAKSTVVSNEGQTDKELVFRYGWRTIAVNLAGVFFLAGIVMIVGISQLPQNTWALVLVLLGASLLAVRLVLEYLNPRELRISRGRLMICQHGKETSVPLTDLHLVGSGSFSIFLDYDKVEWDHGSILIFSHISGYRVFREKISGS